MKVMCFLISDFVLEKDPNFIACWKQIPNEILNHILSYNGTIKQRNGKYMNQMLKTDPRYELLTNIPKVRLISYGFFHGCKVVDFSNPRYKLVMKVDWYLSDSSNYDKNEKNGVEYWQITKEGTRYEFQKGPYSSELLRRFFGICVYILRSFRSDSDTTSI